MKLNNFLALSVAAVLSASSSSASNNSVANNNPTVNPPAGQIANVPGIVLNNGLTMPQFGLGTYMLAEGEVSKNAVLTALKKGSRHINYIEENINVFDFELNDEDMAAIRSLDSERRFFNMTYEQVTEAFSKYELDD